MAQPTAPPHPSASARPRRAAARTGGRATAAAAGSRATRAEDADEPLRPGDAYVQSFARGLAVIKAFSAASPALTLSEVAAATALTRAGARRILLTLQTLGYVALDGRVFRLTPRILDLGYAYLSTMPLWNVAEPIMEDLVRTVHESSSASVLDGTDIVYVVRVPTGKIMTINLAIGSRLPAWCTSMGRVLLGGLPPDELDRVLKRSRIEAQTARTITDRRELKRVIAADHAKGWSMVNQELEEGLCSVSAPIHDRAGRIIAALNISGQVSRTSPTQMQREFVPHLKAAAGRIDGAIRLRT
jgi:IclR family pca regulon transcriptional regulator